MPCSVTLCFMVHPFFPAVRDSSSRFNAVSNPFGQEIAVKFGTVRSERTHSSSCLDIYIYISTARLMPTAEVF